MGRFSDTSPQLTTIGLAARPIQERRACKKGSHVRPVGLRGNLPALSVLSCQDMLMLPEDSKKVERGERNIAFVNAKGFDIRF